MNKNMLLMIILTVFGLINAQEQGRLDLLRQLQNGSVLCRSHYSQDNHQALAEIQSDFDLLDIDSKNAFSAQKTAEGYFYSAVIPGVLNLIKGPSGLASSLGLVGSAISSYLVYNVWTQPADITSKVYLGGTDLYYGRSVEAVCKKIDFLVNYAQDKEYNAAVLVAGATFPLVAFVSFLIYKCAAGGYRNYCQRNALFIEDMKRKQDLNKLVVAKLNDIRFDIMQQYV